MKLNIFKSRLLNYSDHMEIKNQNDYNYEMHLLIDIGIVMGISFILICLIEFVLNIKCSKINSNSIKSKVNTTASKIVSKKDKTTNSNDKKLA